MQVQRINNYSRISNPNFSAIKSIKYIGEFSNPSNKSLADRIMNAVKNTPEFIEFYNNNDIDIVLDAQLKEYSYIMGKMRNTLDYTLTILYEKPANTIKEHWEKILNPMEKLNISTFFADKTSLSEDTVNQFIETFIKPDGMFTLKHELKKAQAQINKATKKNREGVLNANTKNKQAFTKL